MAGKNPVMYMLKANQEDTPLIQNMMFKVSVKLHSSVALWVAKCTTPEKGLFAKLRLKIKDTEQQMSRVLPLPGIVRKTEKNLFSCSLKICT